MDLTGMRVEVRKTIAAPAVAVWDLLTDLSRVGEWSPECVRAEWRDGQGPRVGARFTGHNVLAEYEWSVECVVMAADRPRGFGWVVLDGDMDVARPSSYWRYDLEALPGDTTRVVQSFAHGPGGSGLAWRIARRPADAERLVERRRERLRSNMVRTLDAMESVAVGATTDW